MPIVIILIIFFTWQIINWDKQSILFSIDYKEKSNEIQAYSGIMGFLLGFLSIIFVIITIIEQREYFQKNLNLKEKEEKDLRKNFTNFAIFYLNDVLKNTNEFAPLLKAYYLKELEKPLDNNNLIFTATNNNKRFSNIDNLQLFKSFTENFNDGSKIYNDFLKYTDFYIEAITELKIIFKKHINNKFERKRSLALDLNEIMDLTSIIIENFKHTYPESHLEKAWFNLLNDFIFEYYNLIEPEKETDFILMDNIVLMPFLLHSKELNDLYGFEFNIQELVLKVSKVRKLLYSLILDCQVHAKEYKGIYIKYFSNESELLQNLYNLKIKMNNFK